jgi:hypothetical protein
LPVTTPSTSPSEHPTKNPDRASVQGIGALGIAERYSGRGLMVFVKISNLKTVEVLPSVSVVTSSCVKEADLFRQYCRRVRVVRDC